MYRSSIDTVGVVISLVLAALPMTWWLRSIVFFLITLFVYDLIFRLPWFRKLPAVEPLKIYFFLCLLFIVLLLTKDRIRQEYLKEQSHVAIEGSSQRAEPTKPTEKKLPERPKDSPQLPPPLKEPKVEKAVLSIELAPRVLTHGYYYTIDSD